ncbi:MAG: response regulator transcription factor [Dehalococcoidia bacterium]
MRVLLVGIDTQTAAQIEAALGLEIDDLEFEQRAAARLEADDVRAFDPDVIFVDARALEACPTVRRASDQPMLVLTGNEPIDRGRALRLGATGFVRQPFLPADLLTRVRAAARLLGEPTGAGGQPAFEAGPLRIDYAARSVTVSGGAVRLSAVEYGILYHLARHAGRTLSHRTLLSKVWGREFADDIECLTVQVEQLRVKLNDAGAGPPGITSRQGVGFALIAEPLSSPARPA